MTALPRGKAASAIPPEVSEHVAIIAHELATPIASIAAAAQLLASECEGRAAAARAAAIAAEAREAFALLESLGDLSSLELGHMPLSLVPVDLAQTVRSSVSLVDGRGHHVVLDLPDKAVMARGDARRIRQVLQNLLCNAVKYAPEGTVIDVSVVAEDDEMASVSVRDHGPGIPERERARLFGKFVRLTTAGETRGSGLGLYLSRQIVEQHGGQLTASWPAGGGTRFTFTLPLASSREGALSA